MELVEPSLGKAETEALKTLEPQLKQHGLLTIQTYNLLSKIVDTIPEMRLVDVPQSLKVAVALMIRITNDLRSLSLLALRGYPTQAATLAASVYETAFTIAYIGSDERLSQDWINHDEPTRPFRSIMEMIKKVFSGTTLNNPELAIASSYRVYSQLCLAKHSNPIYMMQHTYQRKEHIVRGYNGPDTSDDSIRAAWFSMEHGTRLSILASASFVDNFVPKHARPTLQTEVDQVGKSCNALAKIAVDRFGSKDPFPGKWKR